MVGSSYWILPHVDPTVWAVTKKAAQDLASGGPNTPDAYDGLCIQMYSIPAALSYPIESGDRYGCSIDPRDSAMYRWVALGRRFRGNSKTGPESIVDCREFRPEAKHHSMQRRTERCQTNTTELWPSESDGKTPIHIAADPTIVETAFTHSHPLDDYPGIHISPPEGHRRRRPDAMGRPNGPVRQGGRGEWQVGPYGWDLPV